MKTKIQLLDCTLRDGAYVVDGKFDTPVIKGIIKKLQQANIDNQNNYFLLRSLQHLYLSSQTINSLSPNLAAKYEKTLL